MPDQNLVDNVRKESYALSIYRAFNSNEAVIAVTTNLIKFIQEIYRNLEPSHFNGNLIVLSSLDDSIQFAEAEGNKLYDKSILINNNSNVLVVQYFQIDKPPILWQSIDIKDLFERTDVLIYSYQNRAEHFIANKQKIEVINHFDCASIYALQYHYLSEALLKYKQERIRFSSCEIFQQTWFDISVRLYFKQQPEEQMQRSLKEYLTSSLRGVDVVREYNLGASKPVDIRVYWKEANRAALIEIKWLGRSKKGDGTLGTSYSNGRGNDGLDQVKEYMDLENQDTPTCVTKGYLVIIDGRRRGLNGNSTSINSADGLFYADKEMDFDDTKKFYETVRGFERPIRMFTEPICS